MPIICHECDDCEQKCGTLSRLRLHDCLGNQPAETIENSTTDTTDELTGTSLDDSGLDREKLEREYPEVVGDLPKLFDGAREGDLSALFRAIAEYERVLTKVSRGDAPGGNDLHGDLLFAYYEPLADGFAAAAEANGWDVLIEFADAYDRANRTRSPK